MLEKRLRILVVLGLIAVAAVVGASAVSAFERPLLTDCALESCPPQPQGSLVGTCTMMFASGPSQSCSIIRLHCGGECYACP